MVLQYSGNVRGSLAIPVYFAGIVKCRAIGLMRRVFANSPGDRGSIEGRVIPKTPKMVLDDASLNTQHYKVKIKGKVEQSREWGSVHHYNSAW